ncbi:MAG: hypothetical protein WD696_14060 [Bryobacteraceae bacterium]
MILMVPASRQERRVNLSVRFDSTVQPGPSGAQHANSAFHQGLPGILLASTQSATFSMGAGHFLLGVCAGNPWLEPPQISLALLRTGCIVPLSRRDDFLGQFRRNSHASFALRYSF